MREAIARLRAFRGRGALGVAGAMLALAGYALAAATTGSGATPVTKAKFYSADDFRGTHVGTGMGWDAIGLGQQICNGNGEFRAEADLPDGARITRLTFFFRDNNPTANFDFGLVAFLAPADGSINDDLTPPTSSNGASDSVRKIEISPVSPVVIDNGKSDMELAVNYGACGEDLILYGARIKYEVP
jgi:hypothetical protein